MFDLGGERQLPRPLRFEERESFPLAVQLVEAVRTLHWVFTRHPGGGVKQLQRLLILAKLDHADELAVDCVCISRRGGEDRIAHLCEERCTPCGNVPCGACLPLRVGRGAAAARMTWHLEHVIVRLGLDVRFELGEELLDSLCHEWHGVVADPPLLRNVVFLHAAAAECRF